MKGVLWQKAQLHLVHNNTWPQTLPNQFARRFEKMSVKRARTQNYFALVYHTDQRQFHGRLNIQKGMPADQKQYTALICNPHNFSRLWLLFWCSHVKL